MWIRKAYLSLWFLPHFSSWPRASWELTILFGKLSKSFKTVFKSCNSTFVLLQLKSCQASSVHLDFSSANGAKYPFCAWNCLCSAWESILLSTLGTWRAALGFSLLWKIGSRRIGAFLPDAGKAIPEETEFKVRAMNSHLHCFSSKKIYIYIFFPPLSLERAHSWWGW